MRDRKIMETQAKAVIASFNAAFASRNPDFVRGIFEGAQKKFGELEAIEARQQLDQFFIKHAGDAPQAPKKLQSAEDIKKFYGAETLKDLALPTALMEEHGKLVKRFTSLLLNQNVVEAALPEKVFNKLQSTYTQAKEILGR